MAPPPKISSDNENNSSASSKRSIFMKKYIEEQKMARRFEKAKRTGIRASSQPHKPFPPNHPTPPVNFKLLIQKHPELASRFK